MTTDFSGDDRVLSASNEEYWDSLLRREDNLQVEQHNNEPVHHETGDIRPSSQSGHDTEIANKSIWQEAQRLYDEETTLELKVTGANRGGLLVNWNSLQGFVPTSQLVNSLNANRSLDQYIGQTLRLRVIELYPDKNRLILSERVARVEPGKRAAILRRVNPGDIVEGLITNLTDFGAFVDLGGVEGLIHISELSWGRVSHPADMLERGQRVQAYVLNLDRDRARIALSIKRLHKDPWTFVEERYHIDQVVEGRITNVVDFGAFACLEEGLEGLIHFSELAEGHFLHPRNVVSEGDIIKARIINIDRKGRRIGLSLRLV